MVAGKNWPRKEYIWAATQEPYTSAQIKERWDEIGEYARNRGKWMHFNIERYFNGLQPSMNIVEMSQFMKFKGDVIDRLGILPYRTEWRITAPDLSLGGSVDFLGQAADGSYVIIDWKRSKDLASNLISNYGKRAK